MKSKPFVCYFCKSAFNCFKIFFNLFSAPSAVRPTLNDASRIVVFSLLFRQSGHMPKTNSISLESCGLSLLKAVFNFSLCSFLKYISSGDSVSISTSVIYFLPLNRVHRCKCQTMITAQLYFAWFFSPFLVCFLPIKLYHIRWLLSIFWSDKSGLPCPKSVDISTLLTFCSWLKKLFKIGDCFS